MAGVGTLLKQAQKMQRGIEALQTQLEAKEIDVVSGGGAVKLKVSGAGKFLALTLDPEFLKQAKDFNDGEMQKVTSGFKMPGAF